MSSPYLDLIAYNLAEGVSPQTIANTLKCVFGASESRYQITNLRAFFFDDVECIKGKKFIFNLGGTSADELLPFSVEEILNRKIDSIPNYISQRIIKKLKRDEKLDPTEAQLFMNILNYKQKGKELKQVPLLEDYVDPSLEDMIFEGVEYDE